MTDGELDPERLARARLRGKRIALCLVGAVAVPFIASSTAQIAGALFGGASRMPDGPPGSPEHVCAAGVIRLEAALERSTARIQSSDEADQGAGSEGTDRPNGEQSDQQMEQAEPTEQAIREACGAARGGAQAWAAFQRLVVAQRQLAHHARAELVPLRRDVSEHLPAELR